MMKLADINNIKLGYPKTTQDKYIAAAPYSYPQSQKVSLDNDEEDLEDADDVDDLEKYKKKKIDIISMSNSWAPFRDVPDIRRTPNKPDTIGA